MSASPANDDEDTDPREWIACQADDHCTEALADWGNPEQDLRDHQFMTIILDSSVDRLFSSVSLHEY